MKGNLGSDKCEMIINGTGCSAEWLMCGRGQMLPQPVTVRPVVICTAEQGKRYEGIAEDVGEYNGEQFVAIRVLRDAAAAGPGRVIKDEDIEGWGVIYRGWCPHPEESDFIRITGDSMEPTIPDGAFVTVDRSEKNPDDLIGNVVAVYQAESDAVTVKRLFQRKNNAFVAVPDNHNLENVCFELKEADHIIGHVRSVHAPVPPHH